MRVALVLRSGGLYFPKHVESLAYQIKLWSDVEILCLTDTEVSKAAVTPVVLTRGWPGWWSKLELFRPDIAGDLLYLDLDTVVLGSLDGFFKIVRRAMLRDFYRDGARLPEGLGSGLMVLPEADRAAIWREFTRNPREAMENAGSRGDQNFLEQHWLNEGTLRLQDVLPSQIVSWKVHCKNGVPEGARILCTHGKPKPWHIPQFQHLYE